MDEAAFANQYIERILNEIFELTKLKLINETRILFLEKVNVEQSKQLESLMGQIEKGGQVHRKEKLNKSKDVEMGAF